MNVNMSTTFVHSVKVPRIYKQCANTVKKVLVDGASFKSLVFKPNHPNVQGIYALVSETLHHCKELQSIIDQTKILIENPRFDPWLARVLITELLWGKKVIKSEAKPVLTVLNYKEKLQQALVQNPDAAVDPCGKKKVKLPRYVRVNTLLTSVDETLMAFIEDGWRLLPRSDSYASHLKIVSNMWYDEFIQDFHIQEVLIFPSGTKFHDHPGYLNGKLLLQDKASCLSAFLLNPKSNSEIMDMCSAPGMKTTHLASIINNQGKIYAIELNENRYKTLCDFVQHTNALCVETIQADALKVPSTQYPDIEYILVDPSCSGSGMVDRIEIRREDPSNLQNRLRKLQSLQSMILSHALLNFPNVKRVVYSTCSIYPEENECVVDEVMNKFGNMYTLVDVKNALKDEWLSFGSVEYSRYGDKCLYALPSVDHCSGFFLAIFERNPMSWRSEVNRNEINDVTFSSSSKAKKRKMDDIETDDLSNEYNNPEVGNDESEEMKGTHEVRLKKNSKQREESRENEEVETVELIKKKKKKKKKDYESERETVLLKSEEILDVHEIPIKKGKTKYRSVGGNEIEAHLEDQLTHNMICNSGENAESQEIQTGKKKKKKSKDKEIDEISDKKINESNEVKSKKRKRNEATKDDEHPTYEALNEIIEKKENYDGFSESSKKEKKKNRKDRKHEVVT